MNVVFEYMIESSICLTILWAFYELVLRHDTRHRRNRSFLLGSMIFSALVPLFNIRFGGVNGMLPEGGLISYILPEMVISPSGSAGRYQGLPALLPKIYLSGIIVSVMTAIFRSLSMLKVLAGGRREGRVIRFNAGEPVCFSALGHVFISDSVTGDRARLMIGHEMNHVRLGHHTDLVLAWIFTLFQWFNPFAYLLRRSLQAVHEFEADSECITSGEDPLSYQELLLESVFRCRVPVISNTFSRKSLLKTRIIMMTKKRTGSIASLKMILALPLALVLVLMFSCKGRSDASKNAPAAETTMETPQEVFTVVEVMPVFRTDTTYGEFFKWVFENLTYPDEAKEKGLEGKVVIRFIVDEEGNVIDPEVVQGADPVLDAAALDVISKCPQWSPGTQNGKAVKVYMNIPVSFQLN